MPAIKINKQIIAFIMKNKHWMSGAAMSRYFGLNRQFASTWMRNNAITVPKEVQERFRLDAIKLTYAALNRKHDPVTEKYIIENADLLPIKVIAANIHRSETYVVGRMKYLNVLPSQEIRDSHRKLFEKGHISANKGIKMPAEVYAKVKATMFKKGQDPPNTYDRDGIIVLRKNSAKGDYNYIRIAKGKWMPYHRYLWMQENGPIPKNSVIRFKDGNSLNCIYSNLKCITRNEHARENHALVPEEYRKVKRLMNKLNNKLKEYDT